MPGGLVECRLDNASDLVSVLAALTLREKDQKNQSVVCVASGNGLKFTAQSSGKDVAVLGWIFKDAFAEYSFHSSNDEDLVLKLPVAPLLSCLTIFTERAALMLRYPEGAHELQFSLEEDGAFTECRLKTLVLDEVPEAAPAFLAPGERPSSFRAKQAEVWFAALSEFQELDASDVVLKVTFRTPADSPEAPAVILKANTIGSDAEVELAHSSLEEIELAEQAATAGEITHSYLLSSVLAGCLKAAKESRAVKVRFNQHGVMSNQFILRSRGRQLLCEALVCPTAEQVLNGPGLQAHQQSQSVPASESMGY